MDNHMIRVLLVAALLVFVSDRAMAEGFKSYVESSAANKPRTDAGVSVEGDRVRLNADLSMRAPGDTTQIVPRLSSSFAISDKLGVEAHVAFAEWNTRSKLSEATFDTKVRFRTSAPFLEELEGQVWRSPDGESKEMLRLGFYQMLRPADESPALTLRGKAVFETAVGPADALGDAGRPQTRRVGIETVLGGFLSRLLAGQNALSLKLERVTGATVENAKSLAFNHAWALPNLTQFALNVRMLSATQSTEGRVEPSVGLSWHRRL